MRKIAFSAVLLLFLASNIVVAAGNATKGKEIYDKKCVACHGKLGEGKKSQKAPKLAGQHEWYIQTQLKAFATKERKNPQMLPFLKGLSPKDFEDLAAYIQSL